MYSVFLWLNTKLGSRDSTYGKVFALQEAGPDYTSGTSILGVIPEHRASSNPCAQLGMVQNPNSPFNTQN